MNRLACFTLILFCCINKASATDLSPAASLRVKFGTLQEQLAQNQFHKPLVLDSVETAGQLEGDIYSVLDYSYAVLEKTLTQTPLWCDVMILHLNVKYCKVSGEKAQSVLSLSVGTKRPQSINAAFRIDYRAQLVADSNDYFQMVLTSEKGPLGTKNYRILLEAIPLNATQTFIHVRYAYAHGVTAKLAMQLYLSTAGRAKVGFTVLKKQPDGKPIYISGLRGSMERNAMRYYLAIEAYLGAVDLAPQDQLEHRLRNWFTLTELYPQQLHEVNLDEYLSMKREEYRRQKNE